MNQTWTINTSFLLSISRLQYQMTSHFSMFNQKQLLREKIVKLRQSISSDIVASRSKIICNRLELMDLFQNARCVAFYYATCNEVLTAGLMETWRDEKLLLLPVITGENMHFYPYTGIENLRKGTYGIPEPVSRERIPPETIDLFVVPGVVFDHTCYRIGRGKGYYDRYLSDTDKPTIGLCYDFQLLEYIPREKHDKKMTHVITESVIVSSPHQ